MLISSVLTTRFERAYLTYPVINLLYWTEKQHP